MSEQRAFKPEFKARVVLEELTGARGKAETCWEYRLRQEFLEQAEIFATERSRGDEQGRIANFEWVVGRLATESGVTKSIEHLDLSRTEKRCDRMLPKEYPKVVCKARGGGIYRSSYYRPIELLDEIEFKKAIKENAAEPLAVTGA